MKKAIIISLFLTISLVKSSVSQNWLPFNTGTELLIKDSYLKNFGLSEYYGFKVDSHYLNDEDTILIFHNNWNDLGSSTCSLDTIGALGEYARYNDSCFMFLDNYIDTIKLLPLAKPGDSWILGETDELLFYAQCVDAYDTIINGFSDSIKIIKIEVMNLQNIFLLHDYSDFIFKLSKNQGLLNFPSFRTFPDTFANYQVLANNRENIDTLDLKLKEIYDFSEGDVFHYREKQRISVTSRQRFTIDSIVEFIDHGDYLYIKHHYTYSDYNIATPYGSWGGYISTNTSQEYKEEYIILADHPVNNIPGLLYEESVTLNSYTANTVFILEDSIFGITKQLTGIDYSLYDSGQCYYKSGLSINYSFHKGLGGPYYDYPTIPHSKKLVYYKKTNSTWGQPLELHRVGIEDLEIEGLKVFPNPVHNKLNIVSPFIKSYNLQIMNSKGQPVEAFDSTNKTKFDISHLEDGVYFYIISVEDQIATGKLIKR